MYLFVLYLYTSSCVVLCILHCPLSDLHFTTIIFCIIEYVTNKRTLNLETDLEKLSDHIATLNSVKCSAGRRAIHLMPHLRSF